MDDRNPYAPPASLVSDPTLVGPKPPMVVTGAIAMIWAWLIIGLATLFLPSAVAFINRPYAIIAIAISAAILLGIPILIVTWLTARIGAGRSWARILVCVALAVGAGYLRDERATLLFLFQGKISMALIWTSQFAKLLLSIITIVLLFTPAANRWFAARAKSGTSDVLQGSADR